MSHFIPNSFQVPNALVDEIIVSLSPNALKCYLIVIRKTVGWQKEWDKISTTQLMLLSGIKKKLTIYKAMQELEDLSLIESAKELGKLTSYRLVAKKDTSTPKEIIVVSEMDTPTSTPKGHSTKDTIKTKDKYTLLMDNLEAKVKFKSKLSKGKAGKELFKLIKDTSTLEADYIKHQVSEKNFAKTINNYMKDYETVYQKTAVSIAHSTSSSHIPNGYTVG